MQPELPFWGGLNSKNSVLVSFLRKEGVAIQNEYSNHASFVMFALGNEISGEDAVLRELIHRLSLMLEHLSRSQMLTMVAI